MDVEGLIDQLCVTAGMIMEDASISAVSTGGDQARRVTTLVRASQEITVLAQAALALVARA
jgi:hypothetical protein